MSRKTMVWLLALGMYLWGAIGPARAQDTGKTTKADADAALAAYRLDFSLHELEDGKKINTRQYSMSLIQGVQWQELKIGTRVPVEMKQGEIEYLDVGTNISARLQEIKSALDLEVRADLSNFAVPDQANKSSMPVLRQLRISGATLVMTGKPVVVGVVDDPNSKRQFQLEVTVSKLK
ncbi:MAG TPA: hypothetical protein VLT90_04510 [Terriglobales bacterium]|nr:hypothetical protein [Terriglobales bacterium]